MQSQPKSQPVDLRPVDRRLDDIETQIRSLRSRLTTPPTQTRRASPQRSGPRLLQNASFGDKDDLKRISGVGPKLERLLNHNGVFYFWQVASWSGSDIVFIDARLDVFKGRIERDNWVSQANSLKREAGAAQEPMPE